MQIVIRSIKVAALAAIGVAATAAHAEDRAERGGRAVFVMTNDAVNNEVVVYPRTDYGTLLAPHRYRTGGRGSGGRVDPLVSQGSLTLSVDGTLLFAVNAGSGTLSMFRIEDGTRLALTARVPTHGGFPTAVAHHGDLVYVLNAAGSSSVVGFRLRGNDLVEIPGSLRFLSGTNVVPASLAFSPDGARVVIAERGTNQLDSFSVNADGTLSASFTATESAGPGLFAVTFAPNATLLSSEAGVGSASAISSYRLMGGNAITPVTTSLPVLGAANCWNAVTPNGRFVCTSNSGSASLSGFSIAASGALSAVPGTVVALNPAGSANLDITITRDGGFLYALNVGSGGVAAFAIDSASGSLIPLGVTAGLPAAAGLNGIVAN
jgi:6-phosphogluconolactonase (cycloisomerase 2 family)